MIPQYLEEELDCFVLSQVPGIGPKLGQILLQHFGSARAIRYATSAELIQLSKITPKIAQDLQRVFGEFDINGELTRLNSLGVRLITYFSPAYPEVLKHLNDPPLVLYAQGEFEEIDRFAVAIVGSRSCSEYGQKHTKILVKALAENGFTVVSGLALGIDGIAHQQAIDSRGRTIAILANGLGMIYPPEHQELAKEVVKNGLILSEMPLKARPIRSHFHSRNRLIAGIAMATVVIEANDKSGAIITAKHAVEQGKSVFVLPANVDSIHSEGSLQLLRDGAIPVRNPDDLLEDLRGILQRNFPAWGEPKRNSILKEASQAELLQNISKSDSQTFPRPSESKSKSSSTQNRSLNNSSLPTTEPASIQANSSPVPQSVSKAMPTDPIQLKILELIRNSPLHMDDLIHELSIPIQEITRHLMIMEINRFIQRVSGNRYSCSNT